MFGGAGKVSPFIVAELSANHLGSLDRAMALVEAASKAGADAIKLQTFTPSQMADAGTILESGPWAGHDLLDLYRQAHTPREWHKPLFDRAIELGLIPFSSVFHPDDVDFLETLGCPMYKISSFELLDLDLIRHVAIIEKPLIISTGMGTEEEIECAVWAAGARHLTLLKCTSSYPASLEDCNLVTIPVMYELFGCDVGLSDHTLGSTAAVAATALGAVMIEKHLTLSRTDGGLDAGFSAEPEEFSAMVAACKEAAIALGEARFGPTAAEASSLPLRRKPGGKRGG